MTIKDKQLKKNKECLFTDDSRAVGKPLGCVPPPCGGGAAVTLDVVGGHTPLAASSSAALSPSLMASAGVHDDYPLFALAGEPFGQFSERALHFLESKQKSAGDLHQKNRRFVHAVSEQSSNGTMSRSSNPYAVLEDVNMDSCTRSASLRGKAKTLVKWYRRLGLPFERDLPVSIECGGLRTAVRQCFSHVSEIWELSFKSIQKIEQNCCDFCEPRFLQRLKPWMEARSLPVEIDDEHLERFKVAFAGNVDKGWDNFRRPFIPNGNASECFKRREGGNWNVEGFSETCRAELVFSSGKPRIVTLYSAENSRILAPLHYSLHHTLERKGWLLVGDPTEQDIKKLTGTRFLSFDYSSATDMIKTAYVRAAVDVLISKASSLREDEIRALRVLSDLRFEGMTGETTRGQPMGSLMSFPLLCLMNKTVVDLAITELLKRKEISFEEWSKHPCLINGDDLLLKEVRHQTNIRDEIVHEGSKVGFIVNKEKTMDDVEKAEINSKLFVGGSPVRKLNVSALWMKPDVNDVLGFAAEAAVDGRSFKKIVRANAHILSKQQDKQLWALPGGLQAICRRDKKIRQAMRASPLSVRPVEVGVIRMVEIPEGYSLSGEEEYLALELEVERVREMGIRRAMERRTKFRTSFVPNARSFNSARKRPMTSQKELIPKCLADRFDLKIREDLVTQELADLSLYEAPFDGSHIEHLVDLIRAGRSTPGPNECDRELLREFVCV